MAVTRAKKTAQVEQLGGELKKVSSMIVATYSKLTVTQDFELRKALRPTGAKYRVVKNTLAERAGKGTKVEEVLKNLQGVTSIAYTSGDPVALAKALAKYAKDNPEFSFKAGVVEGRALLEVAVPVERSVAAFGYGDECGRAEFGGGCQSGRGAEEIQRGLGLGGATAVSAVCRAG